MSVASRRALLLAGAALLAAPRLAKAQISTMDLAGMPLATKLDDTTAPGYRRDVLAFWGDRVAFDAPRFDPANPTPQSAATQFGWDARVADLVVPPLGADGVPRGILAVAHPTVDPAMAFPGGMDRPAVAAGMQGASLLNVERQGGRWIVVDGGYQSRRLHAGTPCRISGPAQAAGAVADNVEGVLAIAGGGATPWASLILVEDDPSNWLGRLRDLGERFKDGTAFGWAIELDPIDPQSTPIKRTALGRFPHGDAAAALTKDGKAVVYMTDRRAFGFLFRFISADPATAPDALDSGTLFVAKLEGLRLRWLALPQATETLLNPVATAERLGASSFDLPSGLALSPRGALYVACAGNAARQPGNTNALNPRAGSPDGHVIEILPQGGDHGAETASASVLFLAGSPANGGQYGRGAWNLDTAWPSKPSTIASDAQGRLWIGTDHEGVVGQAPDALYACETEGPMRGVPLPVYGAPRAAAVGGAAVTPDRTTVLSVVRTPGAEPGASYARPGTRWPSFQPNQPPRTAVIALVREAGPPVGG
ncbi:DUF839 domain-containing protein [Acetobacteraceae bacterium H6797]|nr:DUF839 domain-containing protein [Acetobacteraceae bacterium H6797]